jgi:hypothetical protein
MKRLILIGVALALLVGLIWVPAVAAVSADIIIHKTIGPNCPEETFHFQAWRDMNGSGVLDAGDTLQGTVDITGAGTGVITVGIFGQYIIHEELMPGSVYDPQPDQTVFIACDEHVYFDNICGFTLGQLEIRKLHICRFLLGGATFVIEPDPRTGIAGSSLTVVDNGLNDENPTNGILLVTGCIEGITCTVTETVPPPGYVGGPPQSVTITGSLTFVNKPWWWRWISWF